MTRTLQPPTPPTPTPASPRATSSNYTLTVGHRLEEDLGEVNVVGVGYEARPGREAYGSLGGASTVEVTDTSPPETPMRSLEQPFLFLQARRGR